MNEKYRTARKHHRIRTTVTVLFAVLSVLMVGIMGFFQQNDTIVGSGAILLSLICGAYAAFLFWTDRQGWEFLTTYDDPKLRETRHLLRKDREKEIRNYETLLAITTIGFALLSVAVLVFGILRLCSVV